MTNHSFLIAATSSGSGKTTLSLGLMRALKRRGWKVQPFKCGPDFIDTQYHNLATGNESINLDLFMMSEAHIRNLYHHYGSQSDVNIVEGVMGMFDGYDRMAGSSADIAIKLSLPVVLLINAASTAFSVAATIYGFSRFRKEIKIAGVIFNRVASENHYSFLKEACEETGIPTLGYIRRNEQLTTPSRHLGLTLDSRCEMERFISTAADEVVANVDIDRLLSLTETEIEGSSEFMLITEYDNNRTIAVARDEAFNFIYPVNLKAMNSRIKWFSPLHDSMVPDADVIYLPGGYPELYASELNQNAPMRRSIKEYAASGGKILAECGGMIYLTEEIDGKEMCGVLPLKASMENAKLSLGYRTVYFPDIEIRGHEFHYSHIVHPHALPSVANQINVKGKEVPTPIYRHKNTLAGYTHLYWGETDIFKIWEK